MVQEVFWCKLYRAWSWLWSCRSTTWKNRYSTDCSATKRVRTAYQTCATPRWGKFLFHSGRPTEYAMLPISYTLHFSTVKSLFFSFSISKQPKIRVPPKEILVNLQQVVQPEMVELLEVVHQDLDVQQHKVRAL